LLGGAHLLEVPLLVQLLPSAAYPFAGIQHRRHRALLAAAHIFAHHSAAFAP
jgi:hypothetical protein